MKVVIRLTGVLILGLAYVHAVKAESLPITAEICVEWMAKEGYLLKDVETKNGTTSAVTLVQARELLHFDPEREIDVEKPRYYAFSKMARNASESLTEINQELSDPRSELSRYMSDCKKDDFLCHDHFLARNPKHLRWYCSVRGQGDLLSKALSTYERYAESCAHPAAVYSTNSSFDNFQSNPAYVSNCLGGRNPGPNESGAEIAKRRQARVEMWKKSATFTRNRFSDLVDDLIRFKDRAVFPDAAFFILAKLREELDQHPYLQAERQSYEFGKGLLSSIQPPYLYSEFAHSAAALEKQGAALVEAYLEGTRTRAVFRDDQNRRILYAQGRPAPETREPTQNELIAKVKRNEELFYRKLHRYAVDERYLDVVVPYLAFYLRKIERSAMQRLIQNPGQLASWSEATLCPKGNPYAVCAWSKRPLRDRIYQVFYNEILPCAADPEGCSAILDNRSYNKSMVYDELSIRDIEQRLTDLNSFCWFRRKGSGRKPNDDEIRAYRVEFSKIFGRKEVLFLSMFDEFKEAVTWIDPKKQVQQCYEKGWVFRSKLPRQNLYDIEHKIASKLHEAIAYSDWGLGAKDINDIQAFIRKTTQYYPNAVSRAAQAEGNISAEMGVFVGELLINAEHAHRLNKDIGLTVATLIPAAGLLRYGLMLRGVELTRVQIQVLSTLAALGTSLATGIYQIRSIEDRVSNVEQALLTGQYAPEEAEAVLSELRGSLKLARGVLIVSILMSVPAVYAVVKNGYRYAKIPLKSLVNGKYREAINQSKVVFLRRLNRDPISNAFITESGVIDELLLLSDEAQKEIADAMKVGRGAEVILEKYPGTRLATLVQRTTEAAARVSWLQRTIVGPASTFLQAALTKTYEFFGRMSPWARKQWLLRMFRQAENNAENHDMLSQILKDLMEKGRMSQGQIDEILTTFNLRAKGKFMYFREGKQILYRQVYDAHLETLLARNLSLSDDAQEAARITGEMREFLFRNLSVAQIESLSSRFQGLIRSEQEFKAFQRAVGYSLWLRGKSRDFLFLTRLGISTEANLARTVENFGDEFNELYALSKAVKGDEEALLASFARNRSSVGYRPFDLEGHLARHPLSRLSSESAREFVAFQGRYSKKFYEEFGRLIQQGGRSWDEMVSLSKNFARMHREAAEICKFPSVVNAFSRSAFTTMAVGASLAGKSLAYWEQHHDDPSDTLRIGAKGLIDLTTYVFVKQLKMINFASDPYRAALPTVGNDYGYALSGRAFDVSVVSPVLGEFYLNNHEVRYQKLIQHIQAENIDGILDELESLIGETHPELLEEAKAYVASIPAARSPEQLQDVLFWNGLRLAKDDPMNRFKNLEFELSEVVANELHQAQFDPNEKDLIAYTLQTPARGIEDASWSKPLARFGFYVGFDGFDVVKSFFINRAILTMFCNPRIQLTPAAGNSLAVAFAFVEKYIVSKYVEYPLRQKYIHD